MYLVSAWFMYCTTSRSWKRHMLLLRILLLAYHSCGCLICIVTFTLAFSLFTFVINVLTLSSQYGCNVRGWSVLCPSRWLDWVPHRVGSPRQDHKWTGAEKIRQLFLPNVFMWLLFNVYIFPLLRHLNYRWQESFGEVSTLSPMAAWGIFLKSCADPRPPGQPSSLLHSTQLLSTVIVLFPVLIDEIRNLSPSGLYHLYLCIRLPDILAVCGAIRQWMYSHHFLDHISLRPS